MTLPAKGPFGTLPNNILQNTTYQPSGQTEGFMPLIDWAKPIDSRKMDYADGDLVVTTLPQEPEREEIARDGKTLCMGTGWFKRMVYSTPGFPSPIIHPPKVVYEIREAAGRGLGVFAVDNIQAGDLILAERPLIVKMALHQGVYQQALDLSQEQQLRAMYAGMEESMEAICGRMSPQVLKAFTSLHNSHLTDGSGPLTGILRTNGFHMGVDDPVIARGVKGKGAYSCVGADASRCNHSCSPNASHKFNMPRFAMEVYALRPIAKGEEITVTYTALEVPAATRQIALKPYGFTCSCAACKNPEVSDKERARAILDLLPKTSQGVKHAEEVLAAYEATGLQWLPRYIELLYRVAQINRKKGNKNRADALESLAVKVRRPQSGGARKPVESDKPIIHTFGSPQDLLKFIMQHAQNDTERAGMMNAVLQTMNPASKSMKVMGSDGKEMTVHMSDSIPRPSGL